jgi:hypothetical protein
MNTRRRKYVKRRQLLSEQSLPLRPLRYRRTLIGIKVGVGVSRSRIRAATQEELDDLVRAAELARAGRIVSLA